MDDGTRITPEVEKFLRSAKSRDLNGCQQQLTENPALLNAAEAGGYTALHFAAFNGDVALIDLLVSKGAELDTTNFDGNTPLVMAVKGRQPDAICALAKAGASLDKATSLGSTAIHHAASMGYIDCMKLLQELGANTTFEKTEAGSLLHWASHSGSIPCVGSVMYDLKVPVNTVDKHGGTALMVAVHMQKIEVAAFLLEHGADPNIAIEEDGTTALHVAVEMGFTDCVKLLISCGANSQAKNKAGDTPLSLAQGAGKPMTLAELSKPVKSKEARLAEAVKMKNQGNKVFQNGENVKAAKFYSLAIHLDNTNHIYFSNRAACYFNQKALDQAYFDAVRCIQLDPTFLRGYLRKSATCLALGRFDEAMDAAGAGLKIDPNNVELSHIREEAFKNRQK
eukprot:gene4339-3153_t